MACVSPVALMCSAVSASLEVGSHDNGQRSDPRQLSWSLDGGWVVVHVEVEKIGDTLLDALLGLGEGRAGRSAVDGSPALWSFESPLGEWVGY